MSSKPLFPMILHLGRVATVVSKNKPGAAVVLPPATGWPAAASDAGEWPSLSPTCTGPNRCPRTTRPRRGAFHTLQEQLGAPVNQISYSQLYPIVLLQLYLLMLHSLPSNDILELGQSNSLVEAISNVDDNKTNAQLPEIPHDHP